MHLKRRARTEPQPRRAALAGTLLARVQDELAALRHRELGRDIGSCERCGKPVRSQHNFMRHDGQVTHLRCRVTDPLSGAVSR